MIDYLVMEAVALKVAKEDEELEKKRKHEDFKKGKPGDAIPDGVME